MGQYAGAGRCDHQQGAGWCGRPAVESCACPRGCRREFCEEHRWHDLDQHGHCAACVSGATCAFDGNARFPPQGQFVPRLAPGEPTPVTPADAAPSPLRAPPGAAAAPTDSAEQAAGDVAFLCPHCGQELEAPAALRGTSLPCPSCAADVTVPAETAEVGAAEDETDTTEPAVGRPGGTGGFGRLLADIVGYYFQTVWGEVTFGRVALVVAVAVICTAVPIGYKYTQNWAENNVDAVKNQREYLRSAPAPAAPAKVLPQTRKVGTVMFYAAGDGTDLQSLTIELAAADPDLPAVAGHTRYDLSLGTKLPQERHEIKLSYKDGAVLSGAQTYNRWSGANSVWKDGVMVSGGDGSGRCGVKVMIRNDSVVVVAAH